MSVILSEIHDFSRAVDGLVKEIYLGMIFLQLQVTVCFICQLLSFFYRESNCSLLLIINNYSLKWRWLAAR